MSDLGLNKQNPIKQVLHCDNNIILVLAVVLFAVFAVPNLSQDILNLLNSDIVLLLLILVVVWATRYEVSLGVSLAITLLLALSRVQENFRNTDDINDISSSVNESTLLFRKAESNNNKKLGFSVLKNKLLMNEDVNERTGLDGSCCGSIDDMEQLYMKKLEQDKVEV